jgi:ArsR family transcriptional regulator
MERGTIMVDRKNEIERCDCTVIHEEIVNMVKVKMPEEESLYDLAELFKVFGDSTRIKILWALAESEMCVCDIASLLNMTQSAISHQLRLLKQSRLVKNRKDGKVVYYSLDDAHVKQIFEQGLDHINE